MPMSARLARRTTRLLNGRAPAAHDPSQYKDPCCQYTMP
jgi:hypothetical protein